MELRSAKMSAAKGDGSPSSALGFSSPKKKSPTHTPVTLSSPTQAELRESLTPMKIRQLHQRAEEDGVNHAAIDAADEAEVNEGRLSVTSPLARALIGKESGDAIELNTPSGVRNYEILAIKYD